MDKAGHGKCAFQLLRPAPPVAYGLVKCRKAQPIREPMGVIGIAWGKYAYGPCDVLYLKLGRSFA